MKPGLRDEQIHAQTLGEELGDELPLDAVAGLVEQRGKRPQSAIARGDSDNAAGAPSIRTKPLPLQESVAECSYAAPYSGFLGRGQGFPQLCFIFVAQIRLDESPAELLNLFHDLVRCHLPN